MNRHTIFAQIDIFHPLLGGGWEKAGFFSQGYSKYESRIKRKEARII